MQLAGELDAVTSPWFQERIDGNVPVADGKEVELDLSRVTFLDVAGARAVLTLRDDVLRAGGQLQVRGIERGRLPVVRALGLDELLKAPPSSDGESG